MKQKKQQQQQKQQKTPRLPKKRTSLYIWAYKR